LLMQHVLPKGFRKVRCYGFLHPCSKKIIKLLQLILRFNPIMMGLLGLRLACVIALNIEDVDVETGLLQVTEKGGKQRLLIMPQILCLVLIQYFNGLNQKKGPLFLSRRHKRISPRTLQDIFKLATSELEIDKHLHAHLFRHTAATHLNKVSDPEITKHVLGHMWSTNTQKYTHLNPDQYAVYMQKHPFMEVDL